MEKKIISIPGAVDFTNLNPNGVWFEGEMKIAKKLGINLEDYALHKVVCGLRMRGNSGGKMIPLSKNIDAYEIHIIKVKG